MKSWRYLAAVLSILFGFVSSAAYQPAYSQEPSPDAIELARQFLRDHAAGYSLRQDLSDLKFLDVTSSLGANHVRFQQIYKGVTIYGAYLTVTVPKDRQSPIRVTSRYDPSISLSNLTPQLDSKAALSKALAEIGVREKLRGPTTNELVIYPQGMSEKYLHYVLAWEIKIPAREPLGDWDVFINAATGEVLDKYNRLVSANQNPTDSPSQPEQVSSSATPPPPDVKILSIFDSIKSILSRVLELFSDFLDEVRPLNTTVKRNL